MDDEIAEAYLLDAIVTLVDAKHAAQQLNDRVEAQRQVGFADQIFISKADLVSPQELEALQHRLKHMNPRAPQKVVHFVLDRHWSVLIAHCSEPRWKRRKPNSRAPSKPSKPIKDWLN